MVEGGLCVSRADGSLSRMLIGRLSQGKEGALCYCRMQGTLSKVESIDYNRISSSHARKAGSS